MMAYYRHNKDFLFFEVSPIAVRCSIPREPHAEDGRCSDLSNDCAFPLPFSKAYSGLLQSMLIDLQQRVCSGFAPDSLLTSLMKEDRLPSKSVQRYRFFIVYTNYV